MSSIYIQEPPTSGKVLLKTTVGDLDIELWSRECPKACRNFIQLCMEGYYNNTIFHRVVKGFIAQGGDPNGNGTGGESIYGGPFKDEFHSRLRFTRRGLMGMANSDKDDNASQFFFTFAATPELQNKHTLFGKVTGDTVFNMLKLEECIVDHNEKPLYAQRILGAEILNNPFPDIVPRVVERIEKKKEKKVKEKGVKNFGLLSFGEEAEEDEVETTKYVRKNIAGKSKSTHDMLDDPKLSKETIKIYDTEGKQQSDPEIEDTPDDFENRTNVKEKAEKIKEKLSKKSSTNKKKDDSDSDADYLTTVEDEKRKMRKIKAEEIRKEIVSLKKDYKVDQKKKEELINGKVEANNAKKESSELMKEYTKEKDKYENLKIKVPKKGTDREAFTLALLNKFKNKLEVVKEVSNDNNVTNNEADVENDIKTDDWLRHTLKFQDQNPILAKDASTKSDDWYDVYDPRNPLNKRKRNEANESTKKKRV